MKRYYDPKNNRLIYLNHAASKDFWDQHWLTEDVRKSVTATPKSWVALTTRKFLQSEAKIIVGGCGLANHVYALQQNGFRAVGLDFAPKTVELVQKAAPEIEIKLGDVRNIPFEDNFFDGYWSLGVIEHFWQGYGTIASEMQRVLRSGGYLFLTFPFMSKLRKWKVKLKHYPLWKENFLVVEEFYQFALCPNKVKQTFTEIGFNLIVQSEIDGIKGLKDEIPLLKQILQKVYDSNKFTAKLTRRLANPILSAICGHLKFMIFRKK